MDKKVSNACDNFLGQQKPEEKQQQKGSEEIKETDGLVERIDKTYITESGKILLND